jgi:hypothetical protein
VEVASVAIIPLYRDLLRLLQAAPDRFAALAIQSHPTFFAGLWETYGPEIFGRSLGAALQSSAPALLGALHPAPQFGIEERAAALIDQAEKQLPGPPVDCYLGTLLFTGPAATAGIGGHPAIVVGMERFTPNPPPGGPKQWYRPDEVAEMIPHEAAHVARMRALGLPLSPRHLSLLEMCMLEGTALHFADHLVGRPTLATFMPTEQIAWHEANREALRHWVRPHWRNTGMPTFQAFFGTGAPISGYWIGYDLCRRYLERHGRGSLPELVRLPSSTALNRLGEPPP